MHRDEQYLAGLDAGRAQVEDPNDIHAEARFHA
jgi:hypothetical protein